MMMAECVNTELLFGYERASLDAGRRGVSSGLL